MQNYKNRRVSYDYVLCTHQVLLLKIKREDALNMETDELELFSDPGEILPAV